MDINEYIWNISYVVLAFAKTKPIIFHILCSLFLYKYMHKETKIQDAQKKVGEG